jgi:Leucine-rich repeat (LRR) protein
MPILKGNQVQHLQPLATLTRLRSLSLSGNPLTAEQLAELRQQLPHCMVFG